MRAVDAAAAALKSGGRIIYMGAGTGGRLGVLVPQVPPTFGVPYGLVVGLIARWAGRVAESGRRRGRQPTGRRRRLVALNLQEQDSGRGARGVGSYTM